MAQPSYFLPIGRVWLEAGESRLLLPAITADLDCSRQWESYIPAEPSFLPARLYLHSAPVFSVTIPSCLNVADMLDAFWGFSTNGGQPQVAFNGLLVPGPDLVYMWSHAVNKAVIIHYPRIIRMGVFAQDNVLTWQFTMMGSVTDVPRNIMKPEPTPPARVDLAYEVGYVPPGVWQTAFTQGHIPALHPGFLVASIPGVATVPVSTLQLIAIFSATPSYAGGINPTAIPAGVNWVAQEEPSWVWCGQPDVNILFTTPDVEIAEEVFVKNHLVQNFVLSVPLNTPPGGPVTYINVGFPRLRVTSGHTRYFARRAALYSVFLKVVGSPFTLSVSQS